jgi:hypothetical protein
MTVQIIFANKSTGASMSFLNIECEQWAVDAFCLQLIKPDGTVAYYPLVNIQSFRELQT